MIEHKFCRFCSGNLEEVLNLGELYVSGFVKPGEESYKAPLCISRCSFCGLVQLRDTFDLDFLYKKQYWYSSSLNNSMVSSLKDIVDSVRKLVQLKDGDVVVDIGSSDGTLLSFYPENTVKVGFEPAYNIGRKSESICNYLITDYFSSDLYPSHLSKAKIVTSIAMLYDLPDPNRFTREIKEILDPEGVWVVQLTDLYSMLKLNEFTSFCHEHLEYYKLSDLVRLVNKNGLEVFDLEYNDTNGGSLRLYISFPGVFDIIYNVANALKEEKDYFNSFVDPIKSFHKRILEQREKLLKLLYSIKNEGKNIYALGASTKGSTLCQWFGLDSNIITAIGEVNPDKIGLVTSGTNIPIISENELLDKNPEYVLLIIWQFRDSIIQKLHKNISDNMKIIVPLPKVGIIDKEGIMYL
jgi:NDP-4-keto-2,6-dideoxyhexose 3-C-methyltransferase